MLGDLLHAEDEVLQRIAAPVDDPHTVADVIHDLQPDPDDPAYRWLQGHRSLMAIPVFDGASRFDIVLGYAETRAFDKPGYSGPVLVCNARFRAVSGHRAGKEAVRFMEQNRDMAVWLAPVEASRVLLPMRIEVRTQIGMSVIEAARISIDGRGVARAADGARGASRGIRAYHGSPHDFDKFSLDALVSIATRAGLHVKMEVEAGGEPAA